MFKFKSKLKLEVEAVKVGFIKYDVRNLRYFVLMFCFSYWSFIIALIIKGLSGYKEGLLMGLLIGFRSILVVLIDSRLYGKLELSK